MLLQGWQVSRALGGALAWVLAHPFRVGLVITAALLAWLHFVTVPGLERALEREEEAHQASKDEFEQASLLAEREHAEALARAEASYEALAERSDAKLEVALGNAMDAAERHIARNRVQCPARESDRGQASETAAPAQGRDPQGGERSGQAAELVAVEAEDVRICTTNTLRLEAAREWSMGVNR